MDSEMDMVCIDELENDILCKKNEKFDFPVVCVHDRAIYFNSKCSGLLKSMKIQVSKTNDFVIFREAQSSSANAFRRSKVYRDSGFYISSRRIKQATGLKDGQYFRLYTIKGGGYAIKRHEPLQAPD